MKFATTLKTGVIALAMTALAPAAFADTAEAYIYTTNPSVLKVKSNGQSYTQLDHIGNFVIGGKLEFDAGDFGRVKSWQAYPTITNGYGIASQIPGMSLFKKSDSYGIGHRPKSLNLNLGFPIPVGVVENAAVGMCNWKANAFRNQGRSDKWIFNQNHEVHFELDIVASVDSSGSGSNSQTWEATDTHDFTVRCGKWRGARIDTVGGIQAKPETTHGKARGTKTLRLKVRTPTKRAKRATK